MTRVSRGPARSTSGDGAPPIAIDVTPAVRQRAGIGRYTRELVRALVARGSFPYVLFAADRVDRRQAEKALAIAAEYPPKLRTTPLPERLNAILWYRLGLPLPAELWIGRARLFHATDFLAPPLCCTPRILTIHDLSFLRYPERAVPTLVTYLTRTVPRLAKRADRLLADSEFTAREIVELLGIARERVTVAYPGVGPPFAPAQGHGQLELESVTQRLALKRPYVLGVGTLEPRKDWPVLIAAFARLGELAKDMDLVIAGSPGWLMDGLLRAARADPRVRLLGFVPEADLPALYRGARAFVYPSIYEGFGLPALEALACGTPTIVADTSSLPEVVGDAALRFPAGDIDGLAKVLHEVLANETLRSELARRGPIQASRFTWHGCATAVEQAYVDCLCPRSKQRFARSTAC